jgi:mTERF domain-containing protein, mitochondrial
MKFRFFSYSLEGRIMPRHEILVRNRVNFKLRYMLASSDEEFKAKVQEAVRRRERFESGLVNSDNSKAEETQPVLTD